MTSPPQSSYTVDEVEAIVDLYYEAKPVATRLSTLVRLWDVERAIHALPPKERESLFLIGLVGFDSRTVGTALGVDYTTAWRRYRRGLEYIVNYLNGRP